MRPINFLKALGLAMVVLVLDMACAFAAVFLWSLIVQPAGPITPSSPEVVAIWTMSTRVCGPMLFALIVWIASRKRPDRYAYAFAAAMFGFYLLIDWALVAFKGMFAPAALVIMALKFAGAMAGAWLARRSQAA